MDMTRWQIAVGVDIPAECSREQIEAAVREVLAEQLDSWQVLRVEAQEVE